MARHAKRISLGNKLAEHLSVGVLAWQVPHARVLAALERTDRHSERRRELPAEVVMYLVIALALFHGAACREVLRHLMEGLAFLWRGSTALRVANKASIAGARIRLGEAPVRELYRQSARPLAVRGQPGAFRWGKRLVSIDGSTLPVGDTAANAAAFGRPGASRGESAFPQLRFVGLVESGTHAIIDAEMGAYARSEAALALPILARLKPGMLCLADRLYATYPLVSAAAASGAAFVFRARANLTLPVLEELSDGSYRSVMYGSVADRRQARNGVNVRVVVYRLKGPQAPEETYRLVTNLFGVTGTSAAHLAALYPQRWEHEGSYDELKTHLLGERFTLRSKIPDLVRQEFWAALLAHLVVHGLLVEASGPHEDPDERSFTHAVQVVRRKVATPPPFSPSGST